MPRALRLYVRCVDSTNRVIGRLAMYLIVVMMGMLLFTSISRGAFNVSYIWAVEMAQFMLTTYYILGGAYSVQLDSHVRMDLFYSRWSPRTRAIAGALTSVLVIVYLIVLLIGALSSTNYALEYGQRNFSAWAPPLAPIKIIMTVGITLMLLQMTAVFFREVAAARGKPLE
jgi:TRAP-type mannitol/chloroaromatic compound transport system permease small subunit